MNHTLLRFSPADHGTGNKRAQEVFAAFVSPSAAQSPGVLQRDSAASKHQIEIAELVGVRRSLTRLFRAVSYPLLRGTFVRPQPTTGLLYLRGSVQFFETYPGLYVPRPLELTVFDCEVLLEQLAREMLPLSKLNRNNTQFDGGEPITVRAARRVGDILKCILEGGPVQPSFRFYMWEYRLQPLSFRPLSTLYCSRPTCH